MYILEEEGVGEVKYSDTSERIPRIEHESIEMSDHILFLKKGISMTNQALSPATLVGWHIVSGLLKTMIRE